MKRNKFIITCLGAILFCILFIIALSGDWHWLEGWVFSLWLIAATLSSFIYMYLKDPALLAERSKNQKLWDKYFIVLFYALVILWFVVMPLDKRFSLSSQYPSPPIYLVKQRGYIKDKMLPHVPALRTHFLETEDDFEPMSR
jgi:hypothetical protein